jgi:hypothetical protein
MEVFVVPVPKSKLDKVPADERAFFIHVGHVRNEVAVLMKWLKWSVNDPTNNPVLKNINLSLSFMLDRLLAGKLYESWQLIDRAYIQTGLKTSLGASLSDNARNAFGELENYFSKPKNLINQLRNRFAFHYDPRKVQDQIAAIDETDKLEIYATEKQANLFYLVSEVIVGSAMLETVKRGDYKLAVEKLTQEIMSLSLHVMNFADGCLVVMRERYLGTNMDELAAQCVEIPDPPHRDEILLPYFSL